MKKVLIGFIFVLCLVGGVAIGKIRQQKGKIPGGIVMDTAASPESSPVEMAAADATATDAMATESPTDAAASETPADSTMAAASETSADTAMASSTPEVASDATAISGRSFGTGSSSRKSRTSSGSSGSGSSSSSASSAIADSSFSAPTPRKARASGTPIPDNQVIDVSTPSEDLGAGSESSFDVPPPTSGKKSKTAPAIASSELDELPTIDDGSASGTSPDPFEANSASAAPTPDPFANAVAMAPPSGSGGELNFPSGSGRSLRKVTQKQNGAATVIRIEVSSTAKSKTFKSAKGGKVMIDIEDTDVPGGPSKAISGIGQVREISARSFKSAGGDMSVTRVQILLNMTGEKLPNVTTDKSGNEIIVTIGGASSSEF